MRYVTGGNRAVIVATKERLEALCVRVRCWPSVHETDNAPIDEAVKKWLQ
jgi:hypothetical protein